ncbi:MAG: DNAase [Gammaproteobacteria bacterium]|jgi:TatD DNase family protein|nr:DNAase [Gammaproteobacteria bacterium]
MLPLVDSHCHLDRLDLTAFDGDLSKVIAAAKALGVYHMLCVCVEMENFASVIKIAEQFKEVHASVGKHPDEHEGIEPSVEMLIEKASHPKVVAIGETGLDYYRDHDKAKQMQRFAVHIEAAKRTQKPLIIHTRQAREDTIAMLKSEQAGPGVFHCFTEDYAMAKQGLDLGFYISFSGILTFKNAEMLKEVAKKIPLDRILVETDAPYLTPVPFRGKANQPGYTRYVAEYIAALKAVDYAEVARITTQNFTELFKVEVET